MTEQRGGTGSGIRRIGFVCPAHAGGSAASHALVSVVSLPVSVYRFPHFCVRLLRLSTVHKKDRNQRVQRDNLKCAAASCGQKVLEWLRW